jgi:hypothetical protein
MNRFGEEHNLSYPGIWKDEYRETGFVQMWRDRYPDLFEDHKGSARLGTLDLFPQYALMFLLRNEQGIRSITWYNLASTPERSKNKARTLRYWDVMQHWMGRERFISVRTKLRERGFKNFKGEPDLFCWDPDTAGWFFAEAKGTDRLTESQLRWFQVCREALGSLADIRVYRVVPYRA